MPGLSVLPLVVSPQEQVVTLGIQLLVGSVGGRTGLVEPVVVKFVAETSSNLPAVPLLFKKNTPNICIPGLTLLGGVQGFESVPLVP